MRLDVTGDERLTAMVRGLKFIDREWLKAWTLKGRQDLTPEWSRQLEASRPNALQRKVLVRTSTVALSRRAIVLKAGTKGRLRKGDPVSKIARGVEFGQNQNLRTRYVRKDKPVPAPAQHTVTRRTARPVGPPSKRGKVVWPALQRFVPRAAAVATDLFYDLMRRIPGVD